MIRGGSPLAGKRAGTTKPEAFVAFAALFCAAALPAAAQEFDRELVYDGGEHPWVGTVPWVYYNWGGNIGGLYHFGNETSTMGGISEETWRYIFREDHQGTVKILHTVSPGEIVVESGDYVFAPAGWEDNGLLNQSVDGSIKGSGDLIVNAGASLAIYIDNEYSGDTIVEGTLTAAVNEDSGYNTGHGAFGTGALRVESTGTVNLNGTVQKNAAVEIAGTLNLGENKSGAAAYNPFETATGAVSLVSGGTLDLGGNANVTMPLAVSGGTIAHGTLSGDVAVALALGEDLKLDGATLSQTVSGLELSGGSAVSLENGASLSVNGLVVEVSSVDAAAITLSGNSALTLGGSLQLNIDDALLAELLENQGTASVQVVSVADAGDSGAADCIKGTFASVQVNDGSQWKATFDPTTGGVLISAVPEPAFIGLLFGAFGLLHATRRRPRSRRASAFPPRARHAFFRLTPRRGKILIAFSVSNFNKDRHKQCFVSDCNATVQLTRRFTASPFAKTPHAATGASLKSSAPTILRPKARRSG